MKTSKTSYRGGDALLLETDALELIVSQAVGPRIVSLRAKGALQNENLFLQFPDDEQRYHGYYLRGGHRLWHSPEHLVRTYQPDDLPLAVTPLPTGVGLTQPVEEKTGLQKAMQIELTGPRTVKVTHTLANHGLWTVEVAAWALTMLRPGGFAVLPLLPKGDHAAGDLLPSYALVPWTYTDLALPLWKLHRDYIGIDVPLARQAQKLGLTGYPGWSAYWLNGVTFVKYAPVLTGVTYPDLGCALEVFTNGDMIELETLSPLTRLAPGQTITHTEHWALLEGLAKPVNEHTYSELAAAVVQWQGTL